MVKKVAIIGAGTSGLGALKVCLVEYGFDAWCLEKSHDLGGLWRYKPEEREGEASVMKSTVINTSKEMMAYTDFPCQPETPNFMHNREVLQYFRSYAKAFNLLDRIRYNTEITSVKRAEDYDETGRWEVTSKNLKTGEATAEIYDAVFACTGHHVWPYYPPVKGLKGFEGKVLHSQTYKEPRGHEDERIVVVGIGNSGADVATELSHVAEKVHMVAHRGAWVQNIIYDNGKPLDMVSTTRFMECLKSLFPNLVTAYTEFRVNMRFDHIKYGLKPRHHIFQTQPTVKDDLPKRIQTGSIIVKPGIKAIQPPDTVFYDDGSRLEKVDLIVFCTGYSFGFPYLEDGKLIPVEENNVKLYKQMYAPDLAHPETLAVIGCFQAVGAALTPISEMQSRVACEMLKENPRFHLPDRQVMQDDIAARGEATSRNYVASRRHTIQIDYISFMDELSDMIGAKPSPIGYLLKDPRLALSMFFGPCSPYQYRLRGPHPWKGARDAQLTVWDRAWYPTKTNIGACAKGTHCSCPKDTGCQVRRSVSYAFWSLIAVVFLFIRFICMLL